MQPRSHYQRIPIVLSVVLIGCFVVARAGGADWVEVVYGHSPPAVYERAVLPKVFPAEPARMEQYTAHGLTFNLRFQDRDRGFADPETGAAARDTLRDVLRYVAGVIGYADGVVDIVVEASEFDGTGPIANTGTVFPVSAGVHPGATLYRLNTGTKLFPSAPEMVLQVDFGYPFAVGPEEPGPGELDLHTVLLHEITHGLGFVTRMAESGLSNSFPGGYSVYDALLADRAGRFLLLTDGIVPIFQGDAADLTGFGVAFTGIHAIAGYGQGVPAPVFSAPPFIPGSSLGHWAYGTTIGDALMEPGILPGQVIRAYTPLDLGAVLDLKNYSRGDGRPGDGPSGCAGKLDAAPALSGRADMGATGVVGLLTLLLGRGLRRCVVGS